MSKPCPKCKRLEEKIERLRALLEEVVKRRGKIVVDVNHSVDVHEEQTQEN